MEMPAIVLVIGFVGGSLSGFLGIGGGIIVAPLLLYLPALAGQPPLSMHAVSGLTITQALFAGVFGAIARRRRGTVNGKLAAVMGAVIFAASLGGAWGSQYFTSDVLLGIFTSLALAAAVLIFLPARRGDRQSAASGTFSVPGAVSIATGIGLLGGLVGQGGSFLLIPAMVTFLKVPLRVAMGSNLVIVVCASVAGFAGKAATGQIPATPALALLLGVFPGSLVGTRLSHRAPTRALRWTLGAIIILACIRMVADLTG